MEKPWFKARSYGWGWTPASAEGWIVMAVFLAVVIGSVLYLVHRLRSGADVGSTIAVFVIWNIVLVALLFAIAWAKGEPPRWRWGG